MVGLHRCRLPTALCRCLCLNEIRSNNTPASPNATGFPLTTPESGSLVLLRICMLLQQSVADKLRIHSVARKTPSPLGSRRPARRSSFGSSWTGRWRMRPRRPSRPSSASAFTCWSTKPRSSQRRRARLQRPRRRCAARPPVALSCGDPWTGSSSDCAPHPRPLAKLWLIPYACRALSGTRCDVVSGKACARIRTRMHVLGVLLLSPWSWQTVQLDVSGEVIHKP